MPVPGYFFFFVNQIGISIRFAFNPLSQICDIYSCMSASNYLFVLFVALTLIYIFLHSVNVFPLILMAHLLCENWLHSLEVKSYDSSELGTYYQMHVHFVVICCFSHIMRGETIYGKMKTILDFLIKSKQ